MSTPINAHYSPILNYVGWAAEPVNWTARVEGGQFKHTAPGLPERAGRVLNHKGWDGSDWTAELRPSEIVTYPAGKAAQASAGTIKYISHDGNPYESRWNGAQFYHKPRLSQSNDNELRVSLYIPHVRCNRTTETGPNNRDELYLVAGSSAAPLGFRRFPSNDGYYGATNETDLWPRFEGEVVGVVQSTPQLWSGRLSVGQSVVVSCVASEQDNKDIQGITKVISDIGDFIVGLFGTKSQQNEIGPWIDVARRLTDFMDDADDAVGAFVVRLANNDGVLEMEVRSAVGGTVIAEEGSPAWKERYGYLKTRFPHFGPHVRYIDCHGGENSHYLFLAQAAIE